MLRLVGLSEFNLLNDDSGINAVLANEVSASSVNYALTVDDGTFAAPDVIHVLRQYCSKPQGQDHIELIDL